MATLLFVIWESQDSSSTASWLGCRRQACKASTDREKTPEPINRKVLKFSWCVANQNSFSQTLWFTVIIFQVLAITWHTGQTFVFQIVVKKLRLLLPPLWPLTGLMDGRHIVGPEATHKKREFHETDSSRLHPRWWERPRHLASSSLDHRAAFTMHQTGGHKSATSYNKWHRAGQAFSVIIALKHDNGTLTEADQQQRSARLGSL